MRNEKNVPVSAQGPAPASLASALRPLLIDVGLPVGGYYLLRDGAGLSIWLSLALTGVIPAARAVFAAVAARELNLLALLMVLVSVAGIAISFATGDPQLMLAKESVISSVIAVAILVSVALRRPLMSAGLKPYLIRGCAARAAAWDRLAACSRRFRRLELAFSTIWGLALLGECTARLVGAFTLPVSTMVWLSTVLTIGSIGVAIIVGGIAAEPLRRMIDAEAS
jgi:hypothetical protein